VSALAVYLGVILGVHVLATLFLLENHRTIPKLGPATYPGPPTPAPRASVVVPARDEERNIEACVRSLLAQDYPDLELVVVDDRSTDATGAILDRLAREDGRLRVVHGAPPPAGWLGKNHAVFQGVGVASGDYLLFVDADTDLHRSAVTQAVAYAEDHGADLLTILPTLVNVTFWERAVQPAIGQLVLAWFPSKAINDPAKPKIASANGPFLLFRRSAYEAIGGHAAVKDDIVEDLTLAKTIKAKGLRLAYVKGTALQRLRMYTSLGEIWNGWSKNFFAGVGGSKVGAAVAVALLLAVFVLPWIATPALLLAALLGVTDAARASAWGLAALAAAVGSRKAMDRLYGGGAGTPPSALLQPLGFAVVAAILANSAYRAATGKTVAWKGRAQKIGPA
jgi:chlorobactene glucosyltransferase